ncbi:unnamed protein product [Boreogadus saida]
MWCVVVGRDSVVRGGGEGVRAGLEVDSAGRAFRLWRDAVAGVAQGPGRRGRSGGGAGVVGGVGVRMGRGVLCVVSGAGSGMGRYLAEMSYVHRDLPRGHPGGKIPVRWTAPSHRLRKFTSDLRRWSYVIVTWRPNHPPPTKPNGSICHGMA